MNILWLSHIVPYPPKGGSLQRSYILLKEVAMRNSVFLVAFNQKALLPTKAAVEKSREKLKDHCRVVEVFDIPCERSRLSWYWLLIKNLFSSLPYSVKRLQSIQVEEAVKKIISTHPIDVVYFDTIDLAQYASCIGDLRSLMNHHNVESSLLLRRAKATRNPMEKLYIYIQVMKLRSYESANLIHFHVNLAVSEVDKSELKSIAPEARVEVIPNGVDTSYFRRQSCSIRKNNLVFAGGMNWFPNRDAVLYFLKDIWPLISLTVPDISLTLIGRNPPKKAIEMSKMENIEVLGFVDDVRPYLAQAIACIVPIRVGGGTRLKILDDLACGRAVISTSVGCEGIDVTPGRNILIGDSPREFADQVIKVCTDAKLVMSLGMEGRKLVEEKYSWNLIGERLNAIMSS